MSGRTISSTDKEKKPGRMAQSTKANTSKARNMAKASTVGMTGLSIKEIGSKTRSKVLELTHG